MPDLTVHKIIALALSSVWGIVAYADSFPAANGSIEIYPRVHASVELRYGDLVIQVDPWGINGLEAFARADLVLITDNPGHHLDPEAIRSLSKSNTSVLMPANSKERFPEGIVINNGEHMRILGVDIEAVATYDIMPGAPEHPRGDANGYVITLGGVRILIAGVTECVDEIKALQNIQLAFMPMNIPPARMTPAAAAACTRQLNPAVVYTYHFDQGYQRRLADPQSVADPLPGGLTVAQSVEAFAQALSGSSIEYRRGDWYPLP